ncbi:protease inhibitor I9 family protein [Rossellomorea sp. NS-SX7]|uniref:protease inhibitor I9 family protein n=1 Tax=Rossellomorea sp. NS-SX7 TaxID=3463856 RepID=UPI0040584261
MRAPVEIDPRINLSSTQTISIIIQFIIKPAKVAVLEAKGKGIHLTLEEAKRHVEVSHMQFQEEIRLALEHNHIPYRIIHRYKTAFNGVSMEMPSNEILRLAHSSVIQKIYLNEEIQIDPPIHPAGLY